MTTSQQKNLLYRNTYFNPSTLSHSYIVTLPLTLRLPSRIRSHNYNYCCSHSLTPSHSLWPLCFFFFFSRVAMVQSMFASSSSSLCLPEPPSFRYNLESQYPILIPSNPPLQVPRFFFIFVNFYVLRLFCAMCLFVPLNVGLSIGPRQQPLATVFVRVKVVLDVKRNPHTCRYRAPISISSPSLTLFCFWFVFSLCLSFHSL